MMQFYRNAILFGTPSQALRALYCALRCRSITHVEYYELLKLIEEKEKNSGIPISSNSNRTHSGIS